MNGTSSRAREEGALKYANQEDNYGRSRVRVWEFVLRAVVLGLTLAAAVVLGTNKQTTTMPVQVSASLPAIDVAVSAKWHYLSALIFFVVANAVACGYVALSLILLFLINRGGKSAAFALIMITDTIMVALLFSSVGAATAIGIMGRDGNTHVKWNKVCNVFGGFCDRVAVAIALSLAGSVGLVISSSVSVLGLHRRSN